MKKAAAAIALLACGATLATERYGWNFAFQPFTGHYSIYGGSLGDPVAPNQHSKNVAFSVTGRAAKQMFDAMGPDLKEVCGVGNAVRKRQRAELVCSFDAKFGYECTFGFDLVNGRSIDGSMC